MLLSQVRFSPIGLKISNGIHMLFICYIFDDHDDDYECANIKRLCASFGHINRNICQIYWKMPRIALDICTFIIYLHTLNFNILTEKKPTTTTNFKSGRQLIHHLKHWNNCKCARHSFSASIPFIHIMRCSH